MYLKYGVTVKAMHFKSNIVANQIVSLRCDLENFDLKSIGQQFDVILIEPPLEEYARSYGVTNTKFWEWEKIMALDIGAVSVKQERM